MNLYNLRSLTPNQFQMAKFDEDFNVETVYYLTPKGNGYSCDCPAGQRTVKLKPCKHQKMLRFMLGAVNTDRFYDPDTGQWHLPLAAPAGDSDAEVIEPPKGDGPLSPQAGPSGEHPATEIDLKTAPEANLGRVVEPPKPAAQPIVTRRI